MGAKYDALAAQVRELAERWEATAGHVGDRPLTNPIKVACAAELRTLIPAQPAAHNMCRHGLPKDICDCRGIVPAPPTDPAQPGAPVAEEPPFTVHKSKSLRGLWVSHCHPLGVTSQGKSREQAIESLADSIRLMMRHWWCKEDAPPTEPGNPGAGVSWCPKCKGFLQGGEHFDGRACGTCHTITWPAPDRGELTKMRLWRDSLVRELRHDAMRERERHKQEGRDFDLGMSAGYECAAYRVARIGVDSPGDCTVCGGDGERWTTVGMRKCSRCSGTGHVGGKEGT